MRQTDRPMANPSPDSTAPATYDAGELARITLSEDDGVTVAAVIGEVDISNVHTVGELLDQLPNQALGLVVDLRATSYLDSSGISLLHDLATRLAQRTQRLAIVSDERSLPHRVLTLTGVPGRMPVRDNVPAAVKSVREAIA
jgi:anti-anti-sigma factor